MIIYENDYFVVEHDLYKYIPGFYVIKENNHHWDENTYSINELARLEKEIHTFLVEKGVELIGIYRELRNNKFYVYIIPYHLKVLKMLGISPDMYQPYITNYLNKFDESYLEDVNDYNVNLRKKLRK